MKKIILVVIAILITGIFTGCASKPISNNDDKSFQIDESYEEALWSRFVLSGMVRNYGPGHQADDEREYKTLKNKCFEILNSQEISIYNWYVLQYIWKENPFYLEKFHKKYGAREDWFEEFLKDKELNNNNFTGKIINNSDDIMHIRLLSRKDYNPARSFYIEVQAHTEKYFIIPDVRELDETHIAMQVAVSNKQFWCEIGTQSKKERSNYSKFCQYTFSNYSFELTYNDFEQTYKSEDMLVDDGGIKYSKNWKLVPHYEPEIAPCNKVDFKSLNKYFGESIK